MSSIKKPCGHLESSCNALNLTNNILRRLLCLLLLCFCVTLQAAGEKYLDKNTIYCHSKKALASYLGFVQARDMQGLNMMVETGECDFTPENKNIAIRSYTPEKIGTTSVVKFAWKNKAVWTFEKLLLSSDPK